MSDTMTPCPANDPRMIAWEAYKKTDSFQNTKNWAVHPEYVDGSLWTAFVKGLESARATPPTPPLAETMEMVKQLRELATRQSWTNPLRIDEIATTLEHYAQMQGNVGADAQRLLWAAEHPKDFAELVETIDEDLGYIRQGVDAAIAYPRIVD